MEIELWWLLALPVFFGLGWWAARLDSSRAPAPSKMPDAYFKGLNFLLNEQPDQAIDAFVDVVRLDPDTTELHFALGNLFRRRGETDRAIRVHENLAQRTDLPPSQRSHALYELGQDYLRAGLLDRAEDVFNRLRGSDYAAAALGHRLDIAQKVRDWPLALELAGQYAQSADQQRMARLSAHFYCEQTANASGDEVLRLAKLASQQAPDHPRPMVILGEMALKADDPTQALAYWQPIADQHPAYLNLVAKSWVQAHSAQGSTAAALAALEQVKPAHLGAEMIEAMVSAHVELYGRTSTLVWLKDKLQQRPALAGLDQWLRLQIDEAQARGTSESLAQATASEVAKKALAPQLGKQLRHGCNHCGFKAKRFYWQCPGCQRWDTTSPVRSEDQP
jgi:lipopolysaccharide assembly protein B